MKTILPILVLFIVISSCNMSYKLSKTEWTIQEVKQWALENKNQSTWKGHILYQGSDSVSHHFIGRIMDDWRWFNIKRSELSLNDVRPFNNSSNGQLGYYYVDPLNNFEMVKEY